jgi:hypothetical protein
MECLEVNLTSLSRRYFHFHGIEESGSLSLFCFYCGLRFWPSSPSPRFVSFAKTRRRRPGAQRNDVIVQHFHRAVGDRWQRHVWGFPERFTPYLQLVMGMLERRGEVRTTVLENVERRK